jgi:hypothetical protein
MLICIFLHIHKESKNLSFSFLLLVDTRYTYCILLGEMAGNSFFERESLGVRPKLPLVSEAGFSLFLYSMENMGA